MIGQREILEGWAMVARGQSNVLRPVNTDEIRQCFMMAKNRGATIGFRGAGFSYGDAAINTGQIIIDCKGMRKVLHYDPEKGQITVEPGVTIEQLWQYAVADGWWPASVPGTRKPTVGGCLSMNTHGKNQWQEGSIGDSVIQFTIMLPSCEILRCSREENQDLFHAAIGGFGMFGIFLSITLQLSRIYSGKVQVHVTSCNDLREMLQTLEQDSCYNDDLIGWIDPFASNRQLGRGIIHSARRLLPGEDPHPELTLSIPYLTPSERMLGVFPKKYAWKVLRPFANNIFIHIADTLKFWQAKILQNGHSFEQTLIDFNFKLDYFPSFKSIYRPNGLIQFQAFLDRENAVEAFSEILTRSQRYKLIPHLAVLKKYKAGKDFVIQYSLDGYSLALDYQITPANRKLLMELLLELKKIVFKHKGLFYLAKDFILDESDLPFLYSQDDLSRFALLKKKYDPDLLIQTDLYRRVFATAVENYS